MKPMKIQASRSRMDETHVREGEIPAYFLWDDGSEYEVMSEVIDGSTFYTRRFHGPVFGRKIGDWKTESWSDWGAA